MTTASQIVALPSEDEAEGSVALRDVSKIYGRTTALANASLDIASGELFSILGPSGSGKSTLLHLIAGFIQPTSGSIKVSDREVSALPPYKRGLGVVFQSYNLFPHMSVFDNVAFPLAIRRTPAAEVRDRVAEVLRLVGMAGTEERLPDQLSGGQQQRVAIARAIVFQPRVLLMDEPMSALDRKIRQSLQVEFKRLQRQIGVTMIYVTHDQEEALMMSDRLAVINHGRIEQVGTPEELYETPQSLFVAEFIGDSQTIVGELMTAESSRATARIEDGSTVECRLVDGRLGEDVSLNIRSERIAIQAVGPHASGSTVGGIAGVVSEVLYGGSTVRYIVSTAAGSLTATELNAGRGPLLDLGQSVRLLTRWEDVGCFAASR